MTAIKYLRFVTSKWFIGMGCLVLGAAFILGIRFFTYKPDDIHYHANFAVYLNGQQEQFKDKLYYSDIEMCTENTAVTPTDRAHMHDQINNVVHVEDHAVTWGQFFTNLGWTLGPNFIQARDGTMYIENGDSKLNVIINGQNYTDTDNVANMGINDQDKLLISFGNESTAVLQQQYKAIPLTAHHYDITKDPSTCSGHGSASMHERLRHLF